MKDVNKRAHWEVAQGSPEQNYTYCSKLEGRLDGPYEFGNWNNVGAGKRTDLEEVGLLVQARKTKKAIFEAKPAAFIKFAKGIEAAMDLYRDQQRSWRTRCIVVWGEAGAGKSHLVRAVASWQGDGTVYYKQNCKSSSADWWDGYEGHHSIVMDDFYGWMRFDDFLRLADEQPMQVQIKGGSRPMLARLLFITSNKPPEEWYAKHLSERDPKGALRKAFMRRLDETLHMTKREEYDGFYEHLMEICK